MVIKFFVRKLNQKYTGKKERKKIPWQKKWPRHKECDSKSKAITGTVGESMNWPVSSIGSLMGESEASLEERVMASREAVEPSQTTTGNPPHITTDKVLLLSLLLLLLKLPELQLLLLGLLPWLSVAFPQGVGRPTAQTVEDAG